MCLQESPNFRTRQLLQGSKKIQIRAAEDFRQAEELKKFSLQSTSHLKFLGKDKEFYRMDEVVG
jgi:hypothetical protein